MPTQLLSLFFFLLLLLVLIVATEVLHRIFKVSSEQSRKFLHVSGGLMCLLFPTYFQSHWWLLPLVASSFLLLLFTYIRKLLPSVHQTNRSSIGSVLFPVPVYGCFLAAEFMHNNLLYYLPISLLTISDTAAETGGRRWGHLTRQFFGGQKTLAGSLSFFVTGLFVVFGWLVYFSPWPTNEIVVTGLLIVLAATVAETTTLHGWDNLSVPVVVLAILLLEPLIMK